MNNYTSIFTEKSSLTIDSKGKILNLTLNNGNRERTIIKANPFDPFFSSGNYLLFPWVNRLKTNKIKFKELETVINPIAKDSNNLALHGLIANSERDFTVLEESETESKIEFQPKEQLKNFPSLKEIFVLKHDSIEFQIQFSNISNSNQYFSFGYHPYFQLENPYTDYEIETNLNSLVPLNELLLPEDERTRLGSEILIKNGKITKKLDHCVTSENLESEYFFHIKNKAKEYGILVSTENNPFPLNYFQIYTPNLNSIAIEPMSSCADVFNNPNSIPTCLQPKQSLLFFVKIVLTN